MDAVILAAGEGSRLRPLTSTKPKPMLPVAGKPILQWQLAAMSKAGVKKAYIVVGYCKQVIKDHFGNRFEGVSIEYINQVEQQGTGHALSTVAGKVKGPFIVSNGDLIYTPKTLISFLSDHGKSNSEYSMALVEVDNPSEYGIVKLRNSHVVSLVEKPKNDVGNLANAGMYIFSEEVFPLLEKIKKSQRLEYELVSAFKELMEGGKLHGFPVCDLWLDVGRPWDILSANEIMMQTISLKKNPKAVIEKYVVLKGKVAVGAGSQVKSGAYIEGPVYIGNNCTVGPNCYLRANTVLLDNVKVGNAVEIKNSIICEKTAIGHLAYLGDSIIGAGCNFGAGTKVANLKFDDSHVNVDVKGTIHSSGRRKMGVLMGDGVKTGINVSIMPGRSIYPGAFVDAGSVVKNTIYTETP